MARATDLSYTSVQRIWTAHELKPHLVKTFKLSNDKRFVEKYRILSASTSTRRTRHWCSRSTKKPNPGA